MPKIRWLTTGVAAAASALLLTAVVTGPAHAETLFTDTFDDGNADGWSRNGGAWSIVTDGTPAYRQTGTSGNARALAGTASWTDYTVQARVKSTGTAGVAARAQSTSQYYTLVVTGAGTAQLQRVSGGTATTLATGTVTSSTSWRTLALTVTGGTLTGRVDGTQVVQASDGTFGSGRIGLVTSSASATFDDVTVDTTAPGPGPSQSATSPTPPPPGGCAVTGTATGFAAGTTGGAGGPTVQVDTAAELLSSIATSGPLTICVVGTITLPAGMYDVTSNKSIVGVGATAGITGGGFNIGLPVSTVTTPPANAVHNVIIRNLRLSGASDDLINVQMFSHHIWIDHNDFSGGDDGAVDIKRGSDLVTVSWNRFHDHDKTLLLGHDDDNGAQDARRLRTTYHHNYFDGSDQRHPRVRFGDPVHVYNNYYRGVGLYGVASTENAGVLVEANYFEDTAFPCHSASGYAESAPGRLVQRGNAFVRSGACETGGTVGEPSAYYSYRADSAASVPSLVTGGAGVGRI
jgi:pectate lyase